MGNVGKMVDADNNFVDEQISEKLNESRKLAFENIKSKAILVSLERSVMANFIFDVPFNDKVVQHFNISDDSLIQLRKCLIHPSHMEEMMNVVNDAVMLMWNLTRPWDNNDFRMLPMEMYDDFNETFQKLEDDYEEHLQTFIDGYDGYVKEAKTALGAAFNKDDYPKKKDLKSLFKLKVVTREIPDIDDVRLNITEEDVQKLAVEAGSAYNDSKTAIIASCSKLLDETEEYITNSGCDEKLATMLVKVATMLETANTDSEPAITERIMTFRESVEGTFDNIDFDEAIKTDEQKEVDKYENMKPEDMLMSADEDLDKSDDDLDEIW